MAGHSDIEWKRLGKGDVPSEDQDVGLGHIVSRETYWRTFVCLIVLTVITVWAASKDFGVLNLAIAMGIATVKAALVTLFFMHLQWESKIIWGIVIYPLFIFALIIGGTLGDEMSKDKPAPFADPFESGKANTEAAAPATHTGH